MDVTLEIDHAKIPSRFRDRLTKRVLDRFQRLDSVIRKIRLSLKVQPCESGGKDRVFQIQLILVNGGQIMITEKARHFAQAIRGGIRKARRLLTNELSKQRRHNRQLVLPSCT
ncbi:MAG: ribosome-associated translation inhibitor RaiA [Granulosicoccus sp.]|jgi:ribosome-associated translation inhibitor RaiA